MGRAEARGGEMGRAEAKGGEMGRAEAKGGEMERAAVGTIIAIVTNSEVRAGAAVVAVAVAPVVAVVGAHLQPVDALDGRRWGPANGQRWGGDFV